MTKLEFLERAREVHGYKYEYPTLGEKVLSNEDIDVVYNGITYKQRVVKHILMGRCPEKNTPKKTTEQFITEAKGVWGDKYDYSLTKYVGALKKVKVIYDGIVFEQVAISHLSGLAPDNNMNQEYFIKKANDFWGVGKYDYSQVVYKNCSSKVKIIYNGSVYEQTPSLHLYRAPENIHLATRKTTERFIAESNLTHDNKYTYEKTDYITNQVKVIITCKEHGDYTQNPLSHVQGCGCPHCYESKGEKKVAKFLTLNDLTYSRQHKFPGCRNVFELPFDFYIPSMRTIIEFDGKQHYEELDFFGGKNGYEAIKKNDNIKNEYCEDNYIDIIRIRYDQIERVDEILTNNLKDRMKMFK